MFRQTEQLPYKPETAAEAGSSGRHRLLLPRRLRFNFVHKGGDYFNVFHPSLLNYNKHIWASNGLLPYGKMVIRVIR